MYYKRLFYRQFTNHFISGISNIHDLSIGTDSNSERMIEHSNVRTTIFITLHSRKSDRVLTVALSIDNLVSITRIQLLPQSAIYNLPSSVKQICGDY